jgi:hypothetical protein
MGTGTISRLFRKNEGDEIALTPIETGRHSPRTSHAGRVTIQGVMIEIVRRKRQKLAANRMIDNKECFAFRIC